MEPLVPESPSLRPDSSEEPQAHRPANSIHAVNPDLLRMGALSQMARAAAVVRLRVAKGACGEGLTPGLLGLHG